jgi:hypothetical protein
MEKDIINTTIENLYKVAGITARWVQNGPLDGEINLQINGIGLNLLVEVKKELREYQLDQIERRHKEYNNLVIIAEHIFPKLKAHLRKIGIAYIETNGNLFIQNKQLFCFIDTQKKQFNRKKETNRAFTKTGLKVLFHFLQRKELVNKTQREIAQTTGVALGNIPQIINGLKKMGYLVPLNRKKNIWENRKELLEMWVNQYAIELKPKLFKNKYHIREDWQKINLNTETTVWGGEPAADILTNYLRPEKLTLYTKENNLNLMKNYRLIPDINGELEVLEMFWNNIELNETAPPLLIYADLIIEGGKRNIETAQKIYNEFIQPNI